MPTGDEDDDDDDEKRPSILRFKLLTLLAEDNALYSSDEGRITSTIVLRHDRTLAKALVDLLDHDRVTGAAQEAYLQGLVLILLADRHIVELALADARVVLEGAGAAPPQYSGEDDDGDCEDAAHEGEAGLFRRHLSCLSREGERGSIKAQAPLLRQPDFA